MVFRWPDKNLHAKVRKSYTEQTFLSQKASLLLMFLQQDTDVQPLLKGLPKSEHKGQEVKYSVCVT